MMMHKMRVPFGTVLCPEADELALELADEHEGQAFYVVDVLRSKDDWHRWSQATNAGQFEGAGWTYVVDDEGLAELREWCYHVDVIRTCVVGEPA